MKNKFATSTALIVVFSSFVATINAAENEKFAFFALKSLGITNVSEADGAVVCVPRDNMTAKEIPIISARQVYVNISIGIKALKAGVCDLIAVSKIYANKIADELGEEYMTIAAAPKGKSLAERLRKEKAANPPKKPPPGGYWALSARPVGRGHGVGFGASREQAFRDAEKKCKAMNNRAGNHIVIWGCQNYRALPMNEEDCVTIIESFHSGTHINKFFGQSFYSTNHRKESQRFALKQCKAFYDGNDSPCRTGYYAGWVKTYTFCTSDFKK